MKTKLLIILFALPGLAANAQLVVSASGSATICAGDCATLTASASGGTSPYTYVWNPSGQIAQSIVVCPTSSTMYTVTAIDALGSTAQASAAVMLNPTPTATIIGNTQICSGNCATLTATGGGSYSWSNGASAATIVVCPSASTTYSVIASNGICSDMASVTVWMQPSPPAPIAGSNSPVNAGNNLSLTAIGPGISYSWTGPNAFTSSAQNPIIVAVTTAAAGCYSVTVTDSYGCTSPPAITCVTINPFVGVQEINWQTAISISPNPSNGMFNVQWLMANGNTSTINHQPLTIEVYNVYGECIYQHICTSAHPQIDLSDAPSGVYFLHVKTNSGTAVKKIIINK